ncbi:MAG: DUF559 domain-containing protein [Myxococcales bacterium]|nr:DUF559 domain-containing protein [Myxococcales bacterium]
MLKFPRFHVLANILWQELRGCKLGVEVRRQVVLGDHIVDFLVPSAKLIIECWRSQCTPR